MNLIDLVLTVCLLADPNSCRKEHIYFESEGPFFQCMFLAPARIARWSAEHPAVRVVRWTCERPGKSRDI